MGEGRRRSRPRLVGEQRGCKRCASRAAAGPAGAVLQQAPPRLLSFPGSRLQHTKDLIQQTFGRIPPSLNQPSPAAASVNAELLADAAAAAAASANGSSNGNGAAQAQAAPEATVLSSESLSEGEGAPPSGGASASGAPNGAILGTLARQRGMVRPPGPPGAAPLLPSACGADTTASPCCLPLLLPWSGSDPAPAHPAHPAPVLPADPAAGGAPVGLHLAAGARRPSRRPRVHLPPPPPAALPALHLLQAAGAAHRHAGGPTVSCVGGWVGMAARELGGSLRGERGGSLLVL